MKQFALILFISTVLCIFLACNPFAPGESDGEGGGFLLTDQTTPDKVLQNFQYAYTFKDSLVYSELLDSTFIFISENFNVSPPEPIVWGRDQELKITGRMFRIINTIDLTWNNRPLDDPPPGATVSEYRITFTLTLDGGSTIPTLIGEVIFTFVKRGEKWFISRWKDEIPG
jgi:hypothetical protein